MHLDPTPALPVVEPVPRVFRRARPGIRTVKPLLWDRVCRDAPIVLADVRPEWIDLGTCVLVSLFHGPRLRQEGVVIEVVAPGAIIRSERVYDRREVRQELRFVVQCWTRRVVRYADEMAVVAL
jgi:hypothetical protein